MGIKINRPSAPKQVAQKSEAAKDLPAAGDDERCDPFDVERPAKREPASALDVASEPAPDAPQGPKTSPSPCQGMTVLFRTQDKDRQYNGADVHPAVITRVWPKCVNLKVLPDCGAPYDATSQQRIAYSDVKGQGWFTVDEARLA